MKLLSKVVDGPENGEQGLQPQLGGGVGISRGPVRSLSACWSILQPGGYVALVPVSR